MNITTMEYKKLLEIIRRLETRIDEMRNFNTEMDDLMMENDRMAAAYDTLIGMNEMLRASVKSLKADMHNMHDMRRDKEREIRKLKRELYLERQGVDDEEMKGMK